MLQTRSFVAAALFCVFPVAPAVAESETAQHASISVVRAGDQSSEPIDGRVLLMLSTSSDAEPRFQIRDGVLTQQIFGQDVADMSPGDSVTFDASVLGYPATSLRDVPAGEYWVQAVLHRYESFERSDGHVVKLPMDRGEGQHWNRAPGNLYSQPMRIRIDPSELGPIEIVLTETIAPIEAPADTKYVKHVRIQSDLLTEFWGRPMYLGAVVLLPEGFDEHPEARFPLIVNHGHFEATFDEFRETAPDPDLEPQYSERFDWVWIQRDTTGVCARVLQGMDFA